MPLTDPLTVRLSEPERQRLDVLARERGESRAALLRRALRHYADQLEEQREPTPAPAPKPTGLLGRVLGRRP